MPTMEHVDYNAMTYMFKGEPGTRKSTQALSFPGPQFWFSWDGKMSSMALPMRRWGIDPKLVVYEDYDDWNKPRTKLEQFKVTCPYKTLVFDSLTSMCDMTLRQTIKMTQGGKKIAGISVNTIEDYNAESSALQELISLSKDIRQFHKINIILIAHVVQAEYRNTVNNTTHISRTIVTAGKKVAPKIPGYCHEVYHFNIRKGMVAGEGGEYTLLTEHTGDDFARTGLGLDREIVFNNNPIYETYIKPAIDKLTTPTTTTGDTTHGDLRVQRF